MAQIISHTLIITVSKLVKDKQVTDSLWDADQTQMLLETLPGVVEQILDDGSLIVEVQSHPE